MFEIRYEPNSDNALVVHIESGWGEFHSRKAIIEGEVLKRFEQKLRRGGYIKGKKNG